MMSATETFLIILTASLLKPLMSFNHTRQEPDLAPFDHNENEVLSPEDKKLLYSDGAANFVLTLQLLNLLSKNKNIDLDLKRQFDPWGGKRVLRSLAKEELISSQKRQFSPWGGKRSTVQSEQNENELFSDDKILEDYFLTPEDKRNFNSWGGKRNSNSHLTKRGFSAWGGKRNFNAWGGKRNFNPWAGKRSLNQKSNLDQFETDKNVYDKQPSFGSLAAKRHFNSWGGKRSFNSWGGKRSVASELNEKDIFLKEDENIDPATFKHFSQVFERNMR